MTEQEQNATSHTWNGSGRSPSDLEKVTDPDSKLRAFCFRPNKNYLEASPEILKKDQWAKKKGSAGGIFHFCQSSQKPTPPQPLRDHRHPWLGSPRSSAPSQPHPCPSILPSEHLSQGRVIDCGFQTLVSKELPKQLEDLMWMVNVHTETHGGK